MKVNTDRKFIWVVYFVGFDEATSGGDLIEPSIGFERVETTHNDDDQEQDAMIAATIRGGQLLAVVDRDDREKAAAIAASFEKEILGRR